MKPRPKRLLKRLSYALIGLLVVATIGICGAYQYAKFRLFRETPNTLVFGGDFLPVPFEWQRETSGEYDEQHSAILIPVSVSGIEQTLYMQFDTGSQDTFLRTGALELLESHGVELSLATDGDRTCVEHFEFSVAGNRITLKSAHLKQRGIAKDWKAAESRTVIGSLGADFLAKKVCEIDFPAQEIRFHQKRSEELAALGRYTPFKFKGRRIMLPARIEGADVEVFYDSGCSAFGLLTSKYQYDQLTNPSDREIGYGSSRHGESVAIHHRSSDVRIQLGTADLSVQRISYAELYNFLQDTIGRFMGGGFLGNKCLTECTLILDTVSNEFLVVPPRVLSEQTEP